ncbi:MAG: bifunctional DNA-formamidopyrimidine glycosylase/DNA-(apurinic or apyrimidinic site) lyase [Dehalococcoidia bacterium]|jgi:formamidopyrimidine-DNA glycosylase
MPELPEVETVKNELEPHVVGRIISGLTFPWKGIVRRTSLEDFRERVIGQKITGLGRRGKYLIFGLSSGQSLIIHLRMTGSLWLTDPERFVRAIMHLDDGTNVYFRDPRKFGIMWLVDDAASVGDGMGPEALGEEFSVEFLAGKLKSRTAPIKALLCDQGFVAGIGNMYADEALFSAKIHPMRAGGSLTQAEVERLHQAIREVLRAGIKEKGASTDTYFRPSGETGRAHDHFRVAHRRGENCPLCGTPLERLPVRNRGSYFCPNCQPEP